MEELKSAKIQLVYWRLRGGIEPPTVSGLTGFEARRQRPLRPLRAIVDFRYMILNRNSQKYFCKNPKNCTRCLTCAT